MLQRYSTEKHGLSWSSTVCPRNLARLLNNGMLKGGGAKSLPMKFDIGLRLIKGRLRGRWLIVPGGLYILIYESMINDTLS